LNVASDIQRCTAPSALPVLLPLAAGTVALVVVSGVWVVPLYWLCAGVTSGMGMVLQATVLADHVAPERLGRARGILGAVTIVASAAGRLSTGSASLRARAWRLSCGARLPP